MCIMAKAQIKFGLRDRQKFSRTKKALQTPGGGGGVLGISSDGDDQRIFLGLKFSILGFFWVRKFGKFFLGSLI